MAKDAWIQSQARKDVVELATYIGRDSVRAANRFLDSTDETIARLVQSPLLGAEYATNNPRLEGIHVIHVKNFLNHLVFYFARNDEIQVVRVLHGARDLDAALSA